jgi:hypothetical protein
LLSRDAPFGECSNMSASAPSHARASERLEGYLQRLRQRLRALILVRSAAGALLGAALVTILFVGWAVQSAFAPGITLSGRIALGVVLALAVGAGLVGLRALRREAGARTFEARLPRQSGRISTYLDARRRGDSPLLELLADDALRIAEQTSLEEVVSSQRIGAFGAAAVAGLAALIVLLVAAPPSWRYGARHMLLGMELPREIVPLRQVFVTPGDVTVRRNSDVAIRAHAEGFRPEQAEVFVRFADGSERESSAPTWERAPMQSGTEAGAFEFKLFALRSPLSYYVEIDGLRSAEHRIALVDVPQIERLRLTYRYPDWTGLAAHSDDVTRDIRAVAGTKVDVEVVSDTPLADPVLIHDETLEAFQSQGASHVATLSVERPGRYRIAANVAGERVALSDDYAIEIVPDEKPTIQIAKPGRDWRATNIEEVPVRIEAQDDFRLSEIELRYAVNGGDWRTVKLDRNVKQARLRTLLELEKLGAEHASGESLLAPGDLVTYYAVAKDHKRSVQTDLYMVQVQPFERRFLQQNAAGGGGAGEEQGAISERQREILLATWNLQRSEANERRAREQLRDNAKMLAEMQATLAQQARTLAARTRARARGESDERLTAFVESLERAAVAMDPAAEHLGTFALDKAVPAEQQALQQLLRAEAAFREVQVSMQREGRGGGSQSARDFGELLELEMDLEKSQYESESQVAEQRADKEMSEAMRKLKELAQRQEQLAQETNRQQSTPEQRWRQEQLRREAEDLRRQLAAMQQRQRAGGRQQNRSQSSGAQSESASGAAQSGEPSGNENSPQNALQALDRALDQMRLANSQSTPEAAPQSSSQASPSNGGQQLNPAEQAGRTLREAIQRLEVPRAAGIGQALEQLSQRAGDLAREQRNIEDELHESLQAAAANARMRGRAGAIDPERAQRLVERKQSMAEQLEQLQKDLRSGVHTRRPMTEQTRQRLADLANDVESSDVMYRIRRSAAEIYYGRAREAAAREGIITESLQSLADDLRDTATQVAREGERSQPSERGAEQLLAEVAELRRRIDQRARADARGQRAGGSDEAIAEGNAGARGAALSAWNPLQRVPGEQATSQSTLNADSTTKQALSIAERAERLRERATRRELNASELAQLSALARELRSVTNDSVASQHVPVQQALAQLELTALAAVANRSPGEAARMTAPAADAPDYREAIAEYYRRLGSR